MGNIPHLTLTKMFGMSFLQTSLLGLYAWKKDFAKVGCVFVLLLIPLGLYGRLQQLFEGGYHAKKFKGIDFEPKSRLKIGCD